MRAIVISRFGEPAEVAEVQDVPQREPGGGEIRVRMLAAPVNPADLMTLRGKYNNLPTLPATPGYEGVGIVEGAGGGLLPRYLVGKRVSVLHRGGGTWGEFAILPAKQAVPVPDDLPIEQTAMFFVNPATAYVLSRKLLAVPSGQWLLQTAAGSALGKMVIRLGARFGFRTLNVVRRSEQADELRALGADAVVVFDPAQRDAADFEAEVRRVVGSDGVRYAMDPVGGATGSAVIGCLGERAHMVVYGTLSGEPLTFSPRALMPIGARVEGFWLGGWMTRQSLVGKLRLVRTLTRLMREGVLHSDVAAQFPLDQIADALRAAHEPGRSGKILLRIADP